MSREGLLEQREFDQVVQLIRGHARWQQIRKWLWDRGRNGDRQERLWNDASLEEEETINVDEIEG